MAELKTQQPNVAPKVEEKKFPSEIIDLPSGGKIYGKESGFLYEECEHY